MPRAGWLAILKRSIREFKHDDITDRAAALTYYGVLALFSASPQPSRCLVTSARSLPAGCIPS
jgi:hypothetical protein